MKITQGDIVAIIEDGKIKKGVVKAIFDLSNPVALVDFNGDTRKVLVDTLAKVEEDSKEDIQENNEPVEKSEITITPERFKTLAINAQIKVLKLCNDPISTITYLTLFACELHKALFFDDVDNE